MTRHGKRFWLYVLGTVWLFVGTWSSVARADLYGDVSWAIEQVIAHEITTTVIPNLVQKAPQVCYWVPGSLALVQQNRFTALPSQARQEGADAIGYLTENAVLALSKGQRIDITALEAWINDPTSAPVPSGQLLPCDLPKPPNPVCNGVTVSAATLAMKSCAATQSGDLEAACALGLLVRDSIAGDSQSVSNDAQRLAAALVVGAAKAAHVTLDDDQAKQVTVVVLDFLSGKKDLEATLTSPALVNPGTGQPLVDKATLEPILRALAPLHVNGITAGAFIAAAGGTVALCGSSLGANVGPCKVIGALAGGGTTDKVQALEALGQAFFKKDYGLAVGVATDLALGTKCTWANPCEDAVDFKKRLGTGSRLDELTKEFLSKTATFVVDAELSTSQASDAGQGMVDAAETLLSETDTDTGGLHRRPIGWGLVLPTVGLRYGYSPGHLNTAGQSTMRAFPTIDVASLHFPFHYSANWYLGMHVSAFDVLAPLAEAADRPASSLVSGDEVTVWWYGLIAPRADVVVGFPFLSNRLVVGAGIGAHPYRLVALPATRYTYCLFGSTCPDNGDKFVDFGFLEFSLSAKLVL
jgi:hypothetical protein